MMKPNFDTIPQELRARPGWVTWKAEARPGQKKLAKVPYNPRTGVKADPTTPRHRRHLQRGQDGL